MKGRKSSQGEERKSFPARRKKGRESKQEKDCYSAQQRRKEKQDFGSS